MKTEPMPHEKLEEQEIKDLIINIQRITVYLRHEIECEDLKRHIEVLDSEVTRLKKHFCSEKFFVMKVTLAELTDMMRYPDDI